MGMDVTPIRFSQHEKALVNRAARKQGQTFSAFVRSAAAMQAARLLDTDLRDKEFAVLRMVFDRDQPE